MTIAMLTIVCLLVIGKQISIAEPINPLDSRLGQDRKDLPEDVPIPREQLQLLLLGKPFTNLPYSRFILKPISELSESDWPSRERRTYSGGDQSFLRFGRRLRKRPQETKETAFLRFGRSQPEIQ